MSLCEEKAVAIVLARGGSKGLPRKNLLPVAGRACIEWTIDHAVRAESVTQVLVSSDDSEVLAIGRAWADRTDGRVVAVERSAELASDRATVDAAARSVIAVRDGHPDLAVAILYGNVPVRPPGLIDRAVRLLMESGADSVQSYEPVGKRHPWWTARVDPASGAVLPWEGNVLNHGVFRRQDLPPAFIPDGGVVVVRREALMLEIPGVPPGPHAFLGRADRRRGLINGEGEVVDIDTRIDLLVADAVLRERERREGTVA